MNKIYDNGSSIIGQVCNLKEYNDKLYINGDIDAEHWKDLAVELVLLNNDDIVCINYEDNMSMAIEIWSENDAINV